MTRAFRAELIKIARFRMLWITAVVAVAFAVGSAAAGILNAEPAAVGGPAPEDLARAGGGTLSFTVAASFAGAFLLAVFAGAVGVEFSRGTLRTLLMQQPGRLRLVAGKLAALLLFAAVTVAVTQAVSVVAAFTRMTPGAALRPIAGSPRHSSMGGGGGGISSSTGEPAAVLPNG